MPLILRDICKTHASAMRALDRIGPTIPACMYGLPDPVGAGESTPMRVLSTPQHAGGGSAIFDEPGVQHRKDDVRRAAA